jgi:sulfate transport system ATP-binding protein
VFVTHDQEEALEVADRVVVMNEGLIEQVGTPDEVYERPASPFVYEFLGHVNVFHGRLHQGRARIGDIDIDAPDHPQAEQQPAVAYVRPHDIEVGRAAHGESSLPARVLHVNAIGSVVRLELAQEGAEQASTIQAEISKERFRELALVAGDRVYLRPRRFDLFPRRIH